MKKFTAIALVVLMLIMSVPFVAFAAPKWTEVKTADDFAKMTDGNYWLTADIDLSKATWKTVAEFKGTLNGNGHTVTVPKDAPIFDVLSGTVKNVTFKGDMTLGSEDISKNYIEGDIRGYGLGVLANNAYGATLENVTSNVNLTFKNGTQPISPSTASKNPGKGCGMSLGFIGFARAQFELVDYKDGEETKKEIKLTKNTTLTNVTVAGNWNIDFVNEDGRNNPGALIGACWGGVDLELCQSSATVACANSKGNKGGLIGHINVGFEGTGASKGNISHEMSVTINNSIFNGKWTMSGKVGERFGGLVGYGRGFVITNCVNEGSGEGSGSRFGIVGYGNSNGTSFTNKINGCIAVGGAGCGTYCHINCSKSDDTNKYVCEVTNMYRVDNNTVNAGSGKDNGVMTSTDYANKDEARAAFVKANPDAFDWTDATADNKNDGKILLKQPTFTPEADPDFSAGNQGGNQGGNDNVQTGDMTTVMLLISMVALAAVTVTVNVKRKITE